VTCRVSRRQLYFCLSNHSLLIVVLRFATDIKTPSCVSSQTLFPSTIIESSRDNARKHNIEQNHSLNLDDMNYLIPVLVFLTTALAWPNKPTPGIQICTTSTTLVPSVCTVPSTTFSTTTVYVPYTTQTPSITVSAAVAYSTSTQVLTTSTPSTSVIWVTGYSTNYITSAYTDFSTLSTSVPAVTSSASISTCPVVTNVITTSTITRTATVCWTEDKYGHIVYYTVG
jgi:hypothetical protein